MAIQMGNDSAVRRRQWVEPTQDADGDVASAAEHSAPHARRHDIIWVNADGNEMSEALWMYPHMHCLGVVLGGEASDARDAEGRPVADDTFLLLFNAYVEPVSFVLAGREGVAWELILDTRNEHGFLDAPTAHHSGDSLTVVERSMCVFRLADGSGDAACSAAWRPHEHVGPEGP